MLVTSKIDCSYQCSQFVHKSQRGRFKVDLAILRKKDISSVFLSEKGMTYCVSLYIIPSKTSVQFKKLVEHFSSDKIARKFRIFFTTLSS